MTDEQRRRVAEIALFADRGNAVSHDSTLFLVARIRELERKVALAKAEAMEKAAWLARNKDGCEKAFRVSQECSDLAAHYREQAKESSDGR